MVLVVKNPPAKAGDVIEVARYLGREDPLEKGMVTHSSILAWRILWTEETGRLHTVHGVARVGHDLVTDPPHHHLFKGFPGG